MAKHARHFDVAYRDGDHVYTQGAERPASPESVALVLAAPVDGDHDLDGRSDWVWLTLPNGDTILGVWPHGATYEATEADREIIG